MREEAELWTHDSDYDLECARIMLDNGRHNYAVWLARQAVEKALKACFLVVLKQPIPKEHNLVSLATECFSEFPTELRAHLSFLNPHYTTTRYVDAAVGQPRDLYDQTMAQDALSRAGEVITWLKANWLT